MAQSDQLSNEYLISSLVASYKSINDNLEGSFAAADIIFKKFLHQVSCANPSQLKAIEEGINNIENNEIKTQINTRLRKAYKNMGNRLLVQIDLITPKIINSYNNALEDLRDHLFFQDTPTYDYLSKNINFSDMIRDGSLSNPNTRFPNVDGSSIQRPLRQGLCISEMKNSLKNTGSTWQESRTNLITTFETVSNKQFKDGSSFLSSLTEEKSPFLRAIKDLINAMVEELGFKPFAKSKVQLFKETLSAIKDEMSVKELDELPSTSLKK